MTWPEWTSPDGRIRLINADCLEVRDSLPPVDAVIADPPYGMNYNTNSRRFSGGANGDARYGAGQASRPIAGDKSPFDPAPWLEFDDVVLWGYHHFAQRLPVGSVLFWLKKREHRFGAFLSDGELAWRKGGHGVYAKYIPGDGRWDLAEGFPRAHPAQKPVAVMQWSMEHLAEDAMVLDPFTGVATTAIACIRTNRRCS